MAINFLSGNSYCNIALHSFFVIQRLYPSLVPFISLDLSVESAHVDVHRPRTRLGHQSTSTHGARCLLGSAMLKSVSALLSLNRSLIISLATPCYAYARPMLRLRYPIDSATIAENLRFEKRTLTTHCIWRDEYLELRSNLLTFVRVHASMILISLTRSLVPFVYIIRCFNPPAWSLWPCEINT